MRDLLDISFDIDIKFQIVKSANETSANETFFSQGKEEKKPQKPAVMNPKKCYNIGK